MATVHSLTTATINVCSKTYWTGFIAAVNKEAAYELGLQDNINPEAISQSTKPGWSASLFTPNILRHTDVYVDRSTIIDLSSRTTTHVHQHKAPSPPLSEEEQKVKKKQEEEDSLQKYKGLGPIIGAIGAFISAYTWRGYQRCKATHDHTDQVRNNLRNCLNPQLTPLMPTLEKIVAIKLKVDEIRYNILYRYFFASAGILVGGGLFTLGAYTRQPRLIPWGGIALAVSAIWAAASAGLHWQDNKDIRKLYTVIASDPDRLADFALYHLHQFYQEGMVLIPTQSYAHPTYQPFFSNAPAYQAPPPSFVDGYSPDAHYGGAPSAPYFYSDELGS